VRRSQKNESGEAAIIPADCLISCASKIIRLLTCASLSGRNWAVKKKSFDQFGLGREKEAGQIRRGMRRPSMCYCKPDPAGLRLDIESCKR